ncbi:hypothetical protein [Nonomuraea guangzhouensis]|uniref:CBS domain-containing protein n=1 Tax=Nonomuraea guangzhouensis TaxID=1291555 RepID=A0ABW4G6S0_9ACTN|nr:hypothetical protein [Nonomuraea guangzhouensis]
MTVTLDDDNRVTGVVSEADLLAKEEFREVALPTKSGASQATDSPNGVRP